MLLRHFIQFQDAADAGTAAVAADDDELVFYVPLDII